MFRDAHNTPKCWDSGLLPKMWSEPFIASASKADTDLPNSWSLQGSSSTEP